MVHGTFNGRTNVIHPTEPFSLLYHHAQYSFKVQIPEYDNIEIEVYGTGRKTTIAKVI